MNSRFRPDRDPHGAPPGPPRARRAARPGRRAPRAPAWAWALAAAVLVAGCGGGGSDGAAPQTPDGGAPDGPSATASALAGVRVGGDGTQASDWQAASCTTERQRRWVRAKLDEDYLFYRDLPALAPDASSDTPTRYFEALTREALPELDRFSFVTPQRTADAVFRAGEATGLGATLAQDAAGRPRVAYVEARSPAAGRLARGAEVVAVGGEAVRPTGLTRAQRALLYPGAAGVSVPLSVRDRPDAPVRELVLVSAVHALQPLNVQRVLDVDGARVAYLHLSDFSTPAGETALADAFHELARAGVGDLVIDLRYNSGGYLFIAAQLGYMAAGPATRGKVFERLAHNDKRSGEDRTYTFYATVQRTLSNPRAGEALSTLGLGRVYVLASGDTCSASESFVSGLRGAGVEVVQVGGTTCGKPYGFEQADNCTLSYFPIEFEGRNHLGEVFPVTGLTPTCPVAQDDLDHALGDPGEALLAAALTHRRTGACPAAPAAATRAASAAPAGLVATDPLRRIKLLTPPGPGTDG